VTGSSYSGSGTNDDFATIKYNSAGDSVWIRRYNAPDSSDDAGVAVAIDTIGNVYVTGKSTDVTTASDYATVKYNESGDEEWAIRYTNDGSAGSSDEPTGLFVDAMSNVFVTGMSALDYATIKYSQTLTDVYQINFDLPETYFLFQNYPNPFNPSTTISFSIPTSEFVTLKVFNLLGREVTTLVNEEKPNGIYNVQFDGSSLASGVYYYQLKSGEFVSTKKLLLLK